MLDQTDFDTRDMPRGKVVLTGVTHRITDPTVSSWGAGANGNRHPLART